MTRFDAKVIIKQVPEDFFVEELTDQAPQEQGAFALYRLEKTGWTTMDALQAVRRRWQIDWRRLSHGGLKDRHAHTIQHFTIFHGPRRNLHHQRIAVTYLGQIEKPFLAEHIRGNHFRIVVRDLDDDQVALAMEADGALRRYGVPNYFDDQRFGSVTPGGEFVAHALVRGDFDKALRLALTAPYEHDRAAEKKEKALLRQHWTDWPTLKAKLPRGHARSLVDFLTHHPTDFRGACARLRPELRGLYLSAFQSYLWNRVLARWIEANVPLELIGFFTLRLGRFPVPLALDDAQSQRMRELTLPLPSARLRFAEADPIKPIYDSVLAEDNLTLDQLKVKGIRELFFSKGERPALIRPEDLSIETQPDGTHLGKNQLRLTFTLPRGSYATIIIKRMLQVGK